MPRESPASSCVSRARNTFRPEIPTSKPVHFDMGRTAVATLKDAFLHDGGGMKRNRNHPPRTVVRVSENSVVVLVVAHVRFDTAAKLAQP